MPSTACKLKREVALCLLPPRGARPAAPAMGAPAPLLAPCTPAAPRPPFAPRRPRPAAHAPARIPCRSRSRQQLQPRARADPPRRAQMWRTRRTLSTAGS